MFLAYSCVTSTASVSQGGEKLTAEKPGAMKALEDLDALGENLLKQNLPSTGRTGPQFSK